MGRGADGDGHGAGAASARARGRFGIGGESATTQRLKKLYDFREQRKLVALRFDEIGEGRKTFFALGVGGEEADAVVGLRVGLDAAGSVAGDGGVDSDGAGMKEIERPDVERPAGEVHAGGSFGFNAHGERARRTTCPGLPHRQRGYGSGAGFLFFRGPARDWARSSGGSGRGTWPRRRRRFALPLRPGWSRARTARP